ncbi:VOC family protein [Streptococcus sobrinus]|uniref:VOC family protein n=1 Tax=Streptococcus sobrinus TaxID=1310 RepID=UPI0002E09E90|nr:VOC family protein [Streptococcus sobrinus]
MNLKAIHHVAIIVSDYEKSRDFYVNKLGFAVIREHHRPERHDYKLDLCCGQAELEIFGNKTTDPAYQAPSLPIRKDDFTGEKMTFFFDPDGLPLELHE